MICPKYQPDPTITTHGLIKRKEESNRDGDRGTGNNEDVAEIEDEEHTRPMPGKLGDNEGPRCEEKPKQNNDPRNNTNPTDAADMKGRDQSKPSKPIPAKKAEHEKSKPKPKNKLAATNQGSVRNARSSSCK